MKQAYVFRMSMECPHCRTGLPINGFAQEVLCSNCFRSVPLPEEWWAGHLEEEVLEEALTLEPGEGKSISTLGGNSERLEYGNRLPRCQACKTDLPENTLRTGAGLGYCLCPKCQSKISVRPAPPWVLGLVPNADLIVNEEGIGENLGTEGVKQEQPVMFGCLACGAALRVDGSERTVACIHCGVPNYLPDALWLRLHPARTSQVFFVTIQEGKGGNAAPVSLPNDFDEEKALRVLRTPDLPADILEKIFRVQGQEDEVAKSLAKQSNLPEPIMVELADTGRYYEVHLALIKRPSLPIRILELLTHSDDSDVKKALVRHPQFFDLEESGRDAVLENMDLDEIGNLIQNPKFPEWKLLEVAEDANRNEAGNILKSPALTLKVLSCLGRDSGNRPLCKAHPMYRQLSWWKRLFFFPSE